MKVTKELEKEGVEKAVEEGKGTIKEIELTTIPIVVNAGYLVGTSDAIASGFNLLGIRSPLAVTVDIRQFGYNLFRQPPSTFAPVDKVPVGPDYVIGPWDEIKITVWGKIEGQ